MAARIQIAAKATGLVLMAAFGGTMQAQNRAVDLNSNLLAVNHAPALPKLRPAPLAPPVTSTASARTVSPSVPALSAGSASTVTQLKLNHSHGLEIRRGVLTVDGLTAKVDLNYAIADMQFLYVYVPGVGTTVISDAPFAGATEQRNAFDGDVLTVQSGGNRLQLSAERRLLSKRSAFVKFDPTFGPSSRTPVMGYGASAAAPYEWPGALKEINTVASTHPVPPSMKPNLQQQTNCSAGRVAMSNCSTTVMTVAYRH